MEGTLRPFVEALSLGAPLRAPQLEIHPLRRRGRAREPDFAGAEDLEIRETGVPGAVEAVNPGGRAAILLEGAVLRGGAQNRVVSATAVVPAGATVRVPVACVERGRWRGLRHPLTGTRHMAAPEVRRSVKASVARSLAVTAGRCRAADQRAVWSTVGATLTGAGATCWTDDLDFAYVRRGDVLREAAAWARSALDGAVGAVFIRGDGSAGVEAFAGPELASRALEYVVAANALLPVGSGVARDARAVLDDLAAARARAFPAVGGIGEERRWREAESTGMALALGEVVIHLAAEWSARR